jgi:hypothetical protein
MRRRLLDGLTYVWDAALAAGSPVTVLDRLLNAGP